MEANIEVDQLSEELTCQRVMLQSLEGATHEGVEEEREEMRTEIARLRRLLDKARRGEAAIDDVGEYQAPGPLQLGDGNGNGTPGRNSPGSGSHHGSSLAGPSRPSPAPISTPSGRGLDADSFSLPSRKREFSATRFDAGDGLPKSRRTTPTPMDNLPFDFSDRSNGSQIDFVDLTGDDDDAVYATIVEQQVREANRRKQEWSDQQMAVRLQQQSPSQGLAGSSTSSNALDRIMSTQRLNAAPSQAQDAQDPSLLSTASLPSIDRLVPRMPGAYDQTWDTTTHARQFPTSPSVAFGNMPNTPRGAFGGPQIPPMEAEPFTTPGPHHPSRYAPPPPSWRLGPSAQQLPPNPLPSQGSSLSHVINRTNNFDWTNGTDGFGNPLPENLTDFLNDVIHDSRVSDKELDDLLQNIRPDMDIPEKNRGDTPAGLKGTLYHHQELALTWLKQMEEGTNKGGILADDMGLGKTISMLALMLSRKATSRPKTNLIVGPLALVRQWEEEIRTKIKPSHRLSVFTCHGKKTTTDELLKYDVVLTTYGTLASEHKRLEKFKEDNHGRNVDFNDRSVAIKFPLLHPSKARFYRIILDEAQCIKNKQTQTAKGAHLLRGEHRWCLTGTPMMNGVVELFSLLQFLHIKPYCHWEHFRKCFGTLFGKQGEPKSVAMKRLRALLKAIMLRRKKDSELDGKPILRLPPKTEEIIHVNFSDDERDFYKQLEQKSQVIFNKYLRDNSVGRNYSNILVLLLRLRQACCHPHLNLDIEDSNPVSDKDMSDLVESLDPSIIDRIKSIDAFECPICYDAVQSPSFLIPCGHDSCQQCLSQLVDNAVTVGIQQGTENRSARCPVCRTVFEKSFTYEAFQKVHMPEAVQKEESDTEEPPGDTLDSDSDSDSDSDDGSDDDVDKQGNLKGFVVKDDEDEVNDEDGAYGVGDDFYSANDGKPEKATKKTKKKGKGKAKAKDKAADVKPSMLKSLRHDAYKNRASFKKYMAYLRKTWLPSAKVSECMELLKSIQKTEGEQQTPDKTIIFSQWTLLLDLIQVAMYHEGFERKPERYDGSMSAAARNDAAHAFRDKPNVRVILVSLRAGNAGLNLTAASRVIILDPFWNPYIEMQAVDRAYRIGQQREVKVYRILTRETVEDRIVELQEKKKEMVEAALDEDESRKIGRLSTRELRFLFNGTRE